MKRFEERKEDLKKATTKLNEALNGEASELEIDGTLHRLLLNLLGKQLKTV